MKNEHWTVEGSGGHAMHGTTHVPEQPLAGVVLMSHGFKGYKEYGMFPWLAQQFANCGYKSHRFNFSHSGMLVGDGNFERLDLFEKDTWNKQVEDLSILADTLSIESVPLIIFGHSRGGVVSLLCVGRGVVHADRIISLSAPATCNPMTQEVQQELLKKGFIESPSSRTNQALRVGKCFLQEQLDEPESHDLLTLVGKIEVPILVIHGESDPTVSVESASALAVAGKDTTLVRIEGGDHIFNTPNPFPMDGNPSTQLSGVWSAIRSWL